MWEDGGELEVRGTNGRRVGEKERGKGRGRGVKVRSVEEGRRVGSERNTWEGEKCGRRERRGRERRGKDRIWQSRPESYTLNKVVCC